MNASAPDFTSPLHRPSASSTPSEPDRYDAGLLGDGGGGDVAWWQDYLRAELGRAHDHYAMQWETAVAVHPSDDTTRLAYVAGRLGVSLDEHRAAIDSSRPTLAPRPSAGPAAAGEDVADLVAMSPLANLIRRRAHYVLRQYGASFALAYTHGVKSDDVERVAGVIAVAVCMDATLRDAMRETLADAEQPDARASDDPAREVGAPRKRDPRATPAAIAARLAAGDTRTLADWERHAMMCPACGSPPEPGKDAVCDEWRAVLVRAGRVDPAEVDTLAGRTEVPRGE